VRTTYSGAKTDCNLATYHQDTQGLHLLHVVGCVVLLDRHLLPKQLVYLHNQKAPLATLHLAGLWHILPLRWCCISPTGPGYVSPSSRRGSALSLPCSPAVTCLASGLLLLARNISAYLISLSTAHTGSSA
jgi:hypothetical protein